MVRMFGLFIYTRKNLSWFNYGCYCVVDVGGGGDDEGVFVVAGVAGVAVGDGNTL